MLNRADWVLATSTTAIGTGATSITGLTKAIAVGQYHFRSWIPLVNVGAPTNINFGLTLPTTSLVNYTVTRSLVTGTTRVDPYLAATDAAAGTAIVATLAEMEGVFTATATGSLVIRGIRVAGTSSTVQIGAFLECERIG